MSHRLLYGTVHDGTRWAIHVVRIVEGPAEDAAIEDMAERMRQRALSKFGDQAADVVVVSGESKNSLRLFGPADCVRRVRAAMFHTALNWAPIDLD
jgi:hypothetical protein